MTSERPSINIRCSREWLQMVAQDAGATVNIPEPAEDGFTEPVFMRIASPDSLDAAWAEAEALVVSPRFGLKLTHNIYDHAGKHYDYYYASCYLGQDLAEDGSGETPAAALRALAAKLRGVA